MAARTLYPALWGRFSGNGGRDALGVSQATHGASVIMPLHLGQRMWPSSVK